MCAYFGGFRLNNYSDDAPARHREVVTFPIRLSRAAGSWAANFSLTTPPPHNNFIHFIHDSEYHRLSGL